MARVWVIRGGRGNRLVDEFVAGGVIGVGYPSVPDAEALDRGDVESYLRADGTSAAPHAHARMLVDFAHRVAVGDLVVMPDTPRGEVVVGEVTGQYRYHADLDPTRYRHRRAVRWLGRCPFDELPAGRRNLYRQRQTLVGLVDGADLVDHADRIRRDEVGRPATGGMAR